MQSVLEYIRKQWPETTRIHTESEGTLIGLPYPYTVPCARDAFQEMYYWDTYFTCRGLALQGETVKVYRGAVGGETSAAPGTVTAAGKKGIAVAAGDGKAVMVLELQRPGSRRMSAADYLLGHPIAL